jgi:hypothetical protein
MPAAPLGVLGGVTFVAFVAFVPALCTGGGPASGELEQPQKPSANTAETRERRVFTQQ